MNACAILSTTPFRIPRGAAERRGRDESVRRRMELELGAEATRPVVASRHVVWVKQPKRASPSFLVPFLGGKPRQKQKTDKARTTLHLPYGTAHRPRGAGRPHRTARLFRFRWPLPPLTSHTGEVSRQPGQRRATGPRRAHLCLTCLDKIKATIHRTHL